MGVYEQCLALTVNQEGGLSMDRMDPGNWTGGHVGQGLLKGTKWGLSAASYPNLDFDQLTAEQMGLIYYRDYWLPGQCDRVPGPLGALMFDSAVNNGLGRHRQAMWAQLATGGGLKVDGVIGPLTQAEMKKADRDELLSGFQSQRMLYHMGLANWDRYKVGWTHRLMVMVLKCQDVDEGQ